MTDDIMPYQMTEAIGVAFWSGFSTVTYDGFWLPS